MFLEAAQRSSPSNRADDFQRWVIVPYKLSFIERAENPKHKNTG
jgi:hypothetical protein